MTDLHQVFVTAMDVFQRFDASADAVAEQIRIVRGQLAAPECEGARAPFEFWSNVFARACGATSRDAIKALLREYYCTSHAHSASPFNVAQGAMKAATHCLWKRLYDIETAHGHTDVREAVRDAITPRQERAVEYCRALYVEIAQERGETVEAMMQRVMAEAPPEQRAASGRGRGV